MKISAKIDYACRALLELSLHWPNKTPVQINTIAKSQQIPMKFLTQILLNLKQIGFVQSIRGKSGGYLLAMAPNKIKLSEVVQNMGGMSHSLAEHRSNTIGPNVLDSIWGEIDNITLKAMDQITFETVCDRRRAQDQAFVFQI